MTIIDVTQVQTNAAMIRLFGPNAGVRERFRCVLVVDDGSMWLVRRIDNDQLTWIDPQVDEVHEANK